MTEIDALRYHNPEVFEDIDKISAEIEEEYKNGCQDKAKLTKLMTKQLMRGMELNTFQNNNTIRYW